MTHQELGGDVHFEHLLDLAGPGHEGSFQQVHIVFVAHSLALVGQGQYSLPLGQPSSHLHCGTGTQGSSDKGLRGNLASLKSHSVVEGQSQLMHDMLRSDAQVHASCIE